ncbi:MAG: hypothetical protein ACPL3E_01855 [Minisyncoccia bacterium]
MNFYKEKLKQITKENIEVESKKNWDIYDSGLVSGENPLEFDFLKLYPRGFKNLKDYLEKEYKKKKGKIIGIELGGPARRLFSDFSPGFIQKSFGVTLFDKRTEKEKKEDESRNHYVLTFDIFDEDFYEEIKKYIGDRGFDLMFERMEGGWVGFPEEREVFEFFIFRWYELLASNGMAFIQSPYVLNENNFSKWEEWLDHNKINLGKELFDFVYEGKRFYIKIKKDLNKQIRFFI